MLDNMLTNNVAAFLDGGVCKGHGGHCSEESDSGELHCECGVDEVSKKRQELVLLTKKRFKTPPFISFEMPMNIKKGIGVLGLIATSHSCPEYPHQGPNSAAEVIANWRTLSSLQERLWNWQPLPIQKEYTRCTAQRSYRLGFLVHMKCGASSAGIHLAPSHQCLLIGKPSSCRFWVPVIYARASCRLTRRGCGWWTHRVNWSSIFAPYRTVFLFYLAVPASLQVTHWGAETLAQPSASWSAGYQGSPFWAQPFKFNIICDVALIIMNRQWGSEAVFCLCLIADIKINGERKI